MRNILLDTGALVALLDRSEKRHNDCVTFFEGYAGRMLTTEPVLTESLYLLGPAVEAQLKCIEFILRGGAVLAPQSTESLARASSLMRKYSDVPMDFADATLVVLAEEARIRDVFTLDRKGFSAYRIRGKQPFQLWP